MDEDGETAVQIADAPAPVRLSGAAGHKEGCQCPFCRSARGEPRLTGQKGGPARKRSHKASTPRPRAESSAPDAREDDRALSSAETLQAVHDLGNAIWEDPRWEIPDDEAYEFGETTIPLRERYELVDVVLGGGIFGRPLAKLLKIERRRAMVIIPEQGLMTRRRRPKREAEQPNTAYPPTIPIEQWNEMTPDLQAAYQADYAANYGPGVSPIEESPNGR